jgi:hypothetical protein
MVSRVQSSRRPPSANTTLSSPLSHTLNELLEAFTYSLIIEGLNEPLEGDDEEGADELQEIEEDLLSNILLSSIPSLYQHRYTEERRSISKTNEQMRMLLEVYKLIFSAHTLELHRHALIICLLPYLMTGKLPGFNPREKTPSGTKTYRHTGN